MQVEKKIQSAFFITFNGNCKKALTMYQDCFHGALSFDIFDEPMAGVPELPVVSGSLVSEKITIYGSDLVHNEGRRTGNFMAIYMHCEDVAERLSYLKKLNGTQHDYSVGIYSGQKLIEITDPFEVRWIFGI